MTVSDDLHQDSGAPSDDDFAEMVREVRRFVREQVVPLEAEIDEKDEMPERIRDAGQGRSGCTALPSRPSTAGSG